MPSHRVDRVQGRGQEDDKRSQPHSPPRGGQGSGARPRGGQEEDTEPSHRVDRVQGRGQEEDKRRTRFSHGATHVHRYTYACRDLHVHFRLTGKRYHSHMAGVYCVVICKNAAGRAFSFSCSFSSLLCLLLFLLLLLPPFLLLFFLLLLLLFCSLPPALVLILFLFVATPGHKQCGKKETKLVGKNTKKTVTLGNREILQTRSNL